MKAFIKPTLMLAMSATLSFLSLSAHAAPKAGICEIDEDGSNLYKGACMIDTQDNGTIHLTGDALAKQLGVTGLQIAVEQPNVASIEAKKLGGKVTTWGEAKRSALNAACWLGDGNHFKVCAW